MNANIDCVSPCDFIVRVILLVPGMNVARVCVRTRKHKGDLKKKKNSYQIVLSVLDVYGPR